MNIILVGRANTQDSMRYARMDSGDNLDDQVVRFKSGFPAVTTVGKSLAMGTIRTQGTSAELTVAAELRAHGLFYRRNVRHLPGKPDFANRSRGFAVFVNGCFWHQHPGCPKATLPKHNAEFWKTKLEGNVDRDQRNVAALEQMGFKVLVLWECEVSNPTGLRQSIAEFVCSLKV